MQSFWIIRDYHTARKDTFLWMNAHFNETWGTKIRNINKCRVKLRREQQLDRSNQYFFFLKYGQFILTNQYPFKHSFALTLSHYHYLIFLTQPTRRIKNNQSYSLQKKYNTDFFLFLQIRNVQHNMNLIWWFEWENIDLVFMNNSSYKCYLYHIYHILLPFSEDWVNFYV